MPGGKVIYLLRNKITKQFVRYPTTGKLEIFLSFELADKEIDNWKTRWHKGRQMLEVVEIEVAADFKIYKKGA